jgi:hypothetical protein
MTRHKSNRYSTSRKLLVEKMRAYRKAYLDAVSLVQRVIHQCMFCKNGFGSCFGFCRLGVKFEHNNGVCPLNLSQSRVRRLQRLLQVCAFLLKIQLRLRVFPSCHGDPGHTFEARSHQWMLWPRHLLPDGEGIRIKLLRRSYRARARETCPNPPKVQTTEGCWSPTCFS